jgi:hypothetical protein
MPGLVDTAMDLCNRIERLQREADRANEQAEKAAIILYAAQYGRDVDGLYECVRRALSALGYEPDDEGPLSINVTALLANGFGD